MRNLVLGLMILVSGCPQADAARSDAVRAFVQQTLGTSSYKRADADLDGDGRQESLVYVTDRTYCGSGGCTFLVLSPLNHGYRLVLRATVTQLPIALLTTTTNGWRDIGVTVAGGGVTEAYMARLPFDGRRYPANPTVPPAIPLERASGTVLIDD
jgi:hypothetical protein